MDANDLLKVFVDTVADAVLEKLWATEKMKDFLAGKKDNEDIEVKAENVIGLKYLVRDVLTSELDDYKPAINADDVDDLDDHVEKIVKDTLDGVEIRIVT